MKVWLCRGRCGKIYIGWVEGGRGEEKRRKGVNVEDSRERKEGRK